jgi:hypothetical protein
MKTLKKVPVSFKECDDYFPDIREEGVIYISREFQVAEHKCLCGCGLPSVTPLDQGWDVITDNGKVTIRPSVLNQHCGSHYIITNGVANFV